MQAEQLQGPPDSSVPDYIEYLLSPSTSLDFHITVGNPKTSTMQRFGVVKWMLIARSRVLRAMLLESKLRYKEEFEITDLDPNTFKHFLMFLYGYDKTSSLQLEDAIQLLTAAEKYDVQDLKTKVGSVIQSQVTPENVFVVLKEAPVCETVPTLWTTVTKIVQRRTKEVFSHPQFLTASPQVLVHILQQDTLSVLEIDVWRAALCWAKCQVQSKEMETSPENMRYVLTPLLRHTRLCTLSPVQLCREVVPTRILTCEEVEQICLSIGKRESSNNLAHVSCEIQERVRESPDFQVFHTKGELSTGNYKNSRFFILTKQSDIQLETIVCQANKCPWSMAPVGLKYQCEGTVKITRVTDYSNNTSSEPPEEVEFSEEVEYDVDHPISLLLDSGNVLLKANNKYTVDFEFASEHRTFLFRPSKSQSESHHVTDDFEIVSDIIPSVNNYGSHLKALLYHTKDGH